MAGKIQLALLLIAIVALLGCSRPTWETARSDGGDFVWTQATKTRTYFEWLFHGFILSVWASIVAQNVVRRIKDRKTDWEGFGCLSVIVIPSLVLLYGGIHALISPVRFVVGPTHISARHDGAIERVPWTDIAGCNYFEGVTVESTTWRSMRFGTTREDGVMQEQIVLSRRVAEYSMNPPQVIVFPLRQWHFGNPFHTPLNWIFGGDDFDAAAQDKRALWNQLRKLHPEICTGDPFGR